MSLAPTRDAMLCSNFRVLLNRAVVLWRMKRRADALDEFSRCGASAGRARGA
jgi:hypothetical protein